MSDNRRNATLKALIDAAITELMIKTSGEQIYLDDNTTLSSKMAEMVTAINLRDKKTDVDAKIKTVTDSLNSTSESLNNDISTLRSEKADKIALGNLAAKDKVAKDDLDTALQTELDAKATTTDVDTKISALQSSSDTKFSDTDKAINLRPTQTEVTEQITALKQEIMGDLPVEAYDTFTELAAYIEEHQEAADALTAAVGNKADKTVVDDILTVINGLGALANKDKVAKDDLDTALQTELNAKATKTYVDEQVSAIDTSLSGKADDGHTHDDRYYTETEIDTKLKTKSDTSHTHDDRYYTETEIDTKLKTKSDTSHTHDLNTMINALSTESSIPVDADYYISQYAGGGTTNTTYHRRPISALWTYIKGKADKVYAALSHKHIKADITDFPTSMPASDVPAWAKASTKPSYTKSDVGLGNVGNFKAVSTVANQGLTDAEKANARSNIGAGASSFSGKYSDLSGTPTLGTAAAKNVDDFATVKTLTNENLNAVVTPGFYNAGGDNKVTNKPSDVEAFGLIVTHNANGRYYTQILYHHTKSVSYRRYCNNGTWRSWFQEKLTDTTYSDATTSAHGLMTAGMVKKLNGIAAGANKTTVDSALSATSTNPVKNKVINAALENVKGAIDDIKDTAMFIDSFDTDTGTLNTTSVSSSSSSNNPTASSVTFNNTDTGLNATNVQDAVTEVNGKLESSSAIGKKLWSGSFTEGTITVPGLSKYKIFIMNVGGVVCIGNINYGIGGAVGYGIFTIQTYGYRFTSDISLETLTIDSLNKGGSNGTGNVAVTDIYGLL